ncbi:hypothetical protein L9F63_024745, partial [Diploptera punctata]
LEILSPANTDYAAFTECHTPVRHTNFTVAKTWIFLHQIQNMFFSIHNFIGYRTTTISTLRVKSFSRT